jgi:glycosyltransferase involved in cell wall biosynthesis
MQVSVAIRTLNEENSIGKCLQLLSEQTKKPDEVLVVDNESKDKTREIVESYKNKLNIVIIRNKILGYSSGLNLGVKKSSSSHLAFLSADCFPSRVWLEELCKVAEKKKAAVVQGEEEIDATQNEVHYVLSREKKQRTLSASRISFFNNTNTLYDAAILRSQGPFVGKFGGEDVLMSIKYKKAGLKAYLNPRAKVSHVKFRDVNEFKERMQQQGRANVQLAISEPLKPRIYLNPFYWSLREIGYGVAKRDSKFIKVGWLRSAYTVRGMASFIAMNLVGDKERRASD